jgi:hypothetical protein
MDHGVSFKLDTPIYTVVFFESKGGERDRVWSDHSNSRKNIYGFGTE